MDVLSDIIRMLRLRGTVYFRAAFRAPWGMDIPDGEFANFHIVTEGTCWLRVGDDGKPIRLAGGDMVVFPRGHGHALLHEPHAKAIPARTLLSTPEEEREPSRISFGGKGEVTTSLICGHFEYDRDYAHPLFETLDSLMYIPASSNPKNDWVATASRLAATVSETNHPGVGAVIDRVAEALFIQALIGDLALHENPRSFLAAVQDVGIGRALTLIHADMARNLTLSELAQSAGMSRSVFAGKFRSMVGKSPMVYHAHLRLLKARELVTETSMTLSEIADHVGYQSEFSFSKAFKRLFGTSPGMARNAAKTG